MQKVSKRLAGGRVSGWVSGLAPHRRLAVLALALLGSLAAVACDDDPTGPQTPEDVEFAASLGVNLAAMTRLPSGVYIQTLQAGEGEALVDGSRARVDYALWLPSGQAIDAGEDVEFPIAAGSVIDGFRFGVIGMKPGEDRLIVVPSQLGYGASGVAGIPPHSVLVFRVVLRSFTPV